MVISEVIAELEKIKERHGDIEVWHGHDWVEPIQEIKLARANKAVYMRWDEDGNSHVDTMPKRVEIWGS